MTAVHTSLRARDLMTREPVCVTPSTTLGEMVRLLGEHEISGMPVVDVEGTVVGVVGVRDLVRRIVAGEEGDLPGSFREVVAAQPGGEEQLELDRTELPHVEELMTETAVTVRPGDSVRTIARLMGEHRMHRVVVVDEDRLPLGIVTSLDVLTAIGE